MDVVVVLTLPVQNCTAVVFILLIVEASLCQVWKVNSTVDCVDRNKGWLHRDDARSAVSVIRIGIFSDFKTIGHSVAIGVEIQGVRTGSIRIDKGSGVGLNPVG